MKKILHPRSWRAALIVLSLFVLGWSPARSQPGNLVSYAGSAGQEKLLDIVRLSDGTCLAAGTAQDLKAAQAKFDEQLKAVFTPEQYTKFTAMKDEQRDKMRERRAAGQGLPTPE